MKASPSPRLALYHSFGSLNNRTWPFRDAMLYMKVGTMKLSYLLFRRHFVVGLINVPDVRCS
jgi:hypothetical protein